MKRSLNIFLWQKILDFSFDEPDAEYDFTTRLAYEHGWTRSFAEKAIDEYRKFMYLATTSKEMVSPSAIVDEVWHQHLIYTESYKNFAEILGKTIAHIPSNHSTADREKLQRATERTKYLYNQSFGNQPENFWQKKDMYDALNLRTSRISVGLVSLILIFAILLLSWPASHLLKPLYIHIDNPVFPFTFVCIFAVVVLMLAICNYVVVKNIYNKFDKDSFVYNLSPREAESMMKGGLSVADYLDPLVKKGVVRIGREFLSTESKTQMDDEGNFVNFDVKSGNFNRYERQILLIISQYSETSYRDFVEKLKAVPLFSVLISPFAEMRNRVRDSKPFVRLYMLNCLIYGSLLLFGISRCITGYQRDKEITFIVTICIGAVVVVWYRLMNLYNKLPLFIEHRLICKIWKEKSAKDPAWKNYLLMMGLVSPEIKFAEVFIPPKKKSSDSSCSSGDGGGGGCGGGCGGCGGS